MKLPRPYIPLSVRLQVARRQFKGAQSDPAKSASMELATLLAMIFGPDQKLHLDHDPALCNRQFNPKTGKYKPDANDPDYLVYRTKQAHDIKTRVRGDGAQRSDLGQKRYLKRVAAKKNKNTSKRKIAKRRNFTWPKRKMRSRKWKASPAS